MTNTKLFREIASTCGARKRCLANGNDFAEKHDIRLMVLENEFLPSGSGIDNGVSIDRDASTDGRIVLLFSFHHMDSNGGYDGWTDYRAIVTPSFTGYDLRIVGSNRQDIKEYLHQTLSDALDTVSTFYCETCRHYVHVPFAGWDSSTAHVHDMKGGH
jgi:hypothetical protein